MKHAKPRAFSRTPILVFVAAIAALIAGLIAGARWEPVRALIGAAPSTDTATPKQLWTCGMHPQVIRDAPGLCPICQMDLEPLRADGAAANGEDHPHAGPAVTIDPVVVQNMGVRTVEVTRGAIVSTVRAAGTLVEPQPAAHDVTLRIGGWIEKLHADTEGVQLKAGDPLFDLYSPELQVAIGELIAARRAPTPTPTPTPSGDRAASLYRSVERKLLLWGLTLPQIDALSMSESPPRVVTFFSPVAGTITRKDVVAGTSVQPGVTILRVVDLSSVWLEAQVYEQDLPRIAVGQRIDAAIAPFPGETFGGELIFIDPVVNPMTRATRIRMIIPNTEHRLRPGMFAEARIAAQAAPDAVIVPREAVIDTGVRRIVFIDAGNGRFEPRDVRTGAAGDGGVIQVLAGLAPGERVVTSGQFLLDSESRFREALTKQLTPGSAHQHDSAPPAAPPDHTRDAPAPPAPVDGHHHPRVEPAPAEPPPPETAPPPALDAAAFSAAVDHAIVEYLKLIKPLGDVQKEPTPLDMRPMLAAADALIAAAGAERKPLAQRLRGGASGMAGKSLDEQRKSLEPLSHAAIDLVEASPPSSAVASRLFVMHCPMADKTGGSNWLQDVETLANPYFATTMKRCGEVVKTIELVARTPQAEGEKPAP